ncbi:MAG: hypothetical protein A2W91_16035 [Bacteroidetes bacterium GWF2_38_335]|nr:MAG: hypothetical protein A2W91_16035 [Bacteroidetes bacterium GWF2_38_335]OFY81199.1 MAG: hypothetical protein A2281_07010 [Bacteroidetes bacterium RIFOXYA12_FULL_38_20]HBS85315.1 hypothetical protein [Bacteroidales bacterium]
MKLKTSQITCVLFALFIFILHSCSITKRVYQPGYHVELSTKFIDKQKSPNPTKAENETNSNTTGLSNQHQKELGYEEEYLTSGMQEVLETQLEKTNSENTETEIKISKVKINRKDIYKPLSCEINPKDSIDKRESDNRYFSGLAIGSFVLALTGPFIGITIPFAIALGFIALRRIKRNPGVYRGKGFAIAGITIAFLTILFYALMLFILFTIFL